MGGSCAMSMSARPLSMRNWFARDMPRSRPIRPMSRTPIFLSSWRPKRESKESACGRTIPGAPHPKPPLRIHKVNRSAPTSETGTAGYFISRRAGRFPRPTIRCYLRAGTRRWGQAILLAASAGLNREVRPGIYLEPDADMSAGA